MNTKERTELERLTRLWAMGRASTKQIRRCMALRMKQEAA